MDYVAPASLFIVFCPALVQFVFLSLADFFEMSVCDIEHYSSHGIQH